MKEYKVDDLVGFWTSQEEDLRIDLTIHRPDKAMFTWVRNGTVIKELKGNPEILFENSENYLLLEGVRIHIKYLTINDHEMHLLVPDFGEVRLQKTI